MKIETDLKIGDIVEMKSGDLGRVYSMKVNNSGELTFEVEYKTYDTEYSNYSRDELTKLIKEQK